MLSVRNVLIRVRIDVLLGKAEVDDVNHFVFSHGGATDQEVLGLDVTIDQMLGVDILHLVFFKKVLAHHFMIRLYLQSSTNRVNP